MPRESAAESAVAAAESAATAEAAATAAGAAVGPRAEQQREIASGAEERAFRQRKAAEALLAVLPKDSITVAGGAGSRVPASAVADPHEMRITRLIDAGGMRGDGCDKARLFLRDWEVRHIAAVPCTDRTMY